MPHLIVAVVLAGVLVVLGAGVLVAWLRGSLLRRPEAEVPSHARVCAACARRYPAEARFCAVDATPLSWMEGELAEAQLVCRRCDAVYGAGMRFCPIDAEELVRVDEPREGHVHDLAGADVICPVCAARYEGAATFCGRDGTRLCRLH